MPARKRPRSSLGLGPPAGGTFIPPAGDLLQWLADAAVIVQPGSALVTTAPATHTSTASSIPQTPTIGRRADAPELHTRQRGAIQASIAAASDTARRAWRSRKRRVAVSAAAAAAVADESSRVSLEHIITSVKKGSEQTKSGNKNTEHTERLSA